MYDVHTRYICTRYIVPCTILLVYSTNYVHVLCTSSSVMYSYDVYVHLYTCT